ncbi:hypothetical protein B0H21DRAFT_484231 [Amylocystis lapponica]|nr:hypothetical protein B0H21DRAFT_484231 [Amylocystis lapponica]
MSNTTDLSSSTGTRRQRSPSNGPEDGSADMTGLSGPQAQAFSATPPAKRPRISERHQLPAMLPSDMPLPPSSFRTAVDVMQALKNVRRLGQIGNCPTREAYLYQDMYEYGPVTEKFNWKLVQGKINGFEDEVRPTVESGRYDNSPVWLQLVFKELANVHKEHVRSHANGAFSQPFRLRVTRQGCEYDDVVRPVQQDDKAAAEPSGPIAQLLERWYEHAVVSGYGDVRAQETKINSDVRNAREIPAADFSVEPELLKRIQDCWEETFLMSGGVRVEPYKIHLYGHGGHFKTHRDTPQMDLAGTFLVGLGDTTGEKCFCIADKYLSAGPGSWCAFYPDVPHSVKWIPKGHRAVIAFKVFHAAGSSQELRGFDSVRKAVDDVIGRLHTPCGILLERKYALGTTRLSGFDALLLARAREMGDTDVKLLPVVLTIVCEWGSRCEDPYEDFEEECWSRVYPFTEDHIDCLLDKQDTAELGDIYPWLDGLKDVPFYSANFDGSVVTWQDEQNETCNYVGNEAQAWRQDSVYLSYALLLLPKAV